MEGGVGWLKRGDREAAAEDEGHCHTQAGGAALSKILFFFEQLSCDVTGGVDTCDHSNCNFSERFFALLRRTQYAWVSNGSSNVTSPRMLVLEVDVERTIFVAFFVELPGWRVETATAVESV